MCVATARRWLARQSTFNDSMPVWQVVGANSEEAVLAREARNPLRSAREMEKVFEPVTGRPADRVERIKLPCNSLSTGMYQIRHAPAFAAQEARRVRHMSIILTTKSDSTR
jgi:hypothetical protein